MHNEDDAARARGSLLCARRQIVKIDPIGARGRPSIHASRDRLCASIRRYCALDSESRRESNCVFCVVHARAVVVVR